MDVVSVNIGKPQSLVWKNKTLVTSIFKKPFEGFSQVEVIGLEGDTQSDLKVHGGENKAVYAYPSEHYPYWEDRFPNLDFNWGLFGENLTTTGLVESEVFLGDKYRIGSVLLQVTQPRFPCLKLAARFEDEMMVKHFLESRRSGIYFRVLETGSFKRGDVIELIKKEEQTSVRKFVEIYASNNPAPKDVRGVLSDPNLIEEWKEFFEKKLTRVS